MENNQEHKIDKIFRETFEGQEITPPLNAWMGIHTYTIGQEEKKPKVWLKYASLAMLFLLVSGFGLWYFANNQIFMRRDTLKLHSYEVVSEDINHGENNAGRVQNPASVRNAETLAPPVVSLPTQPLVRKQTLPDNISSLSKRMLTLLTLQVDWSGDQPQDDSLTNQNIELIEPVNYSTENNLEIVEPKPLILNDLINKIQKENENKIVALEEDTVDKKEVFKVDSVNYGGKFSLRHPIISLGFGMILSFWDVQRQTPLIGTIDLPNRNLKGTHIKIGIAWKINKKLRVGMRMGINSYDVNIPVISIPQPLSSSATGVIPIIKLVTVYSDQFYQAETPFGNVKLPVSKFKDFPTFTKNVLDEQRQILYNNPHRMNTISFSINSQFDILSKIRKNKGIYGYQFYGITDLVIQRQYGYSYSASDYKKFILSASSLSQPIDNILGIVNQDENHLQNASEFVFGLRTGLGFRYQFARKWDFYVEGSGQHSLNNWVKSDDIKTFQRALSLQAGINLNL